MLKRLLALSLLLAGGALAQTSDIQGGTQFKQPAYPSAVPAVCAVSTGVGSSGQGCLFGALPASTYNPLVQANDSALIFNAGASSTGSLVIAPHSAGNIGMRMTTSGTSFMAGVSVNSGINGVTTASSLNIYSNDASAQGFNFYNHLHAADFNPLVQLGDMAILGYAGASGKAFVIGVPSATANGLRFDSSGNITTGGATGFDLSGSSGAEKTTTGAFSSGASSNTFTNSVGIGAASLSNMRLLVADPSLGDGDVQIGTAYPLVLRTNYPGLGFNEYYNGTHEVYVATNYAGQIQFDNSGNMNFKTAPSGSAAATATMTTRLSIANTGAVAVAGSLQVGGGTVSSNLYHGTCTLNAASPSVCTATVASTSTCVATARGTTAAAGVGLATSISSTTLTITGPNGSSLVVGYICL